MSTCLHVHIRETKSEIIEDRLVRFWSCNDCPKTWEVERPGEVTTWKWDF